MGMFDSYVPVPSLQCPTCGASLEGWQGKFGPCGLFEWVQGHTAPVRQLVDDDVALSSTERSAFRLPPEFELGTNCTGCRAWIRVAGACEGETWVYTWFLSPLEPPGLSNDWMLLRDDDRSHVLSELRREISVGHLLYGARLAPLARRRDCDDVLVRVIGSSLPLYVVHLMWRPGSDPAWPRFRAFRDLSDLAASES